MWFSFSVLQDVYQHSIFFCFFLAEDVVRCVYEVTEKGRYLTQSYDKIRYTHRKIQKATRQHKNATKNFDYKTIADWLRTVSWGNDSNPISVV